MPRGELAPPAASVRPSIGSMKTLMIFSGVSCATCSMSMPPSLERHHRDLLGGAIGQHGDVVLLLDVGAFLDQQAPHLLAFAARSGACSSCMPRIWPASWLDVVERAGELDAAALAAAAGVDLRLDHPDRAAEPLRRLAGFANAECRVAAGHRHAELAQDFLALVFVDLHRDVGAVVAEGGSRLRPHARRKSPEKCSTRLRAGSQRRAAHSRDQRARSADDRRSRCVSRRRARLLPARRRRIAREPAHQALDRPRARSRAPARKRALRALALRRRAAAPAKRRARTAAARSSSDSASAWRQLRRQRDAMLRQLAADAQIAEARRRAHAPATRRSARPRGSGSLRASRAAASTSACDGRPRDRRRRRQPGRAASRRAHGAASLRAARAGSGRAGPAAAARAP